MFCKHAAHNILVDLHAEGIGDLLGDAQVSAVPIAKIKARIRRRTLTSLALRSGVCGRWTLRRLREHHGQLSASPAPGCILYDDLDIPPQAGQAVDQLPLRDTPELSAKDAGQLWLGEAENLGCFHLRQAFAADDFADLVNELRLDQHFLGVRKAEIAVDVCATFVNFVSFSGFTFTHLPAPWRACRLLSTCS